MVSHNTENAKADTAHQDRCQPLVAVAHCERIYGQNQYKDDGIDGC